MKNIITLFVAIILFASCEKRHYYVCATESYFFKISDYGDTAQPTKSYRDKVLTKITHEEAKSKTTEFVKTCYATYVSSIYYYHDKEVWHCDSSRYICWQP